MKELVKTNALDRRHARRGCVVIDQHREGNSIVLGECAGMLRVPGADDHDFTARRRDFRILVAQLRGVRTAVQSTEVAQEDERDVAIVPVVAEPVGVGVGIGHGGLRDSNWNVPVDEHHFANVYLQVSDPDVLAERCEKIRQVLLISSGPRSIILTLVPVKPDDFDDVITRL